MSDALVPRPASDVAFLRVFNRLCVALREPQDDSGITQSVYFDALRDLPIAALDAGAEALMRDKGRRFFPTTAEWRAACEAAQIAQLREAVRPVRTEPWHDECRACGDSGWVQDLVCDGGQDAWPEAGDPRTHIGPPPGAARHRAWTYRAEAVRRTDRPRPSTCGQRTPHAPHGYTQACPCRPTNRTFRRHQSFGSGAV